MANLTRYNISICLIIGLGGFTYGFGFAVFVTSIGQPGFYEYFNLDPTSSYTADILGAVNALFAFGAAMGAIAQGWISDWLGRRKAFATAAACALVGGALAAGSVAIAMLIIVRMLQGFGLGMIISLVPLYLSEVAPPHRRGMLTGLTVMSFGMGYLREIAFGTYYSTNKTLQWRMPLSLACVGPLAVLDGVWFIPESPRYYSWKGKNDLAWDLIRRLHHDPNDPAEHAARAEFVQITRQVEYDRETEGGFIQMFRRPSWRRRSLLVFFLLFASQSTGILGITNFLVLIFGSLGLTGGMPLIMYALYTSIGTIAVFISLFLVDRVGRRRLFLIGFPGLAGCLLAEALLQWKYLGTPNRSANGASLFFIFLYIIFYQCVDAPSFVWAAEIFPTTIRAKGLSLALFGYFVGAITYTTPSALAFKNIGWHMYLLYCGLCCISTVVVYFFVPETKGVPVEELGALFGDEVMVHLTQDGMGIMEDEKLTDDRHLKELGADLHDVAAVEIRGAAGLDADEKRVGRVHHRENV